MSVTVIAVFRAAEGREDQLQNMLAQAVERGPFHPDCLNASLYRNVPDAAEIVLIEEWTSREAHEKFFRESEESGALDALRPCFTELTVRVFSEE